MEENRDRSVIGWSARQKFFIVLFLRLIGGVSLLAFAAALMPEKWMIEIAEELGINDFPAHRLTFYLARNLSLLYGFVGVTLLVVSADLETYVSLVRKIAVGTVIFGVLQLVVDAISKLPLWWTLTEGGSTICGGLLLFWLQSGGYSRRENSEK